nr:TRAP transporter substrate-binding protein [Enterovirga sp. DB1703]
MKLGCEPNPDHPVVIQMMKAAEAIGRDSKGRVELKVFPASQLGSATDMLSQVRSGALEFYATAGIQLGQLVPVAQISSLGFAFEDYSKVWAAMDGDLGAYVQKELSRSSLIAFEKVWDMGYRQITSRDRPIERPQDLEGFKIRVPVSPLWTSMFKSFGASPTSISFAELYSALQTKIADGQENPISNIHSARLYEVQKYCSLTNHMWGGLHFLANARIWRSLPTDVQEIVTTRINAAAVASRADTLAANTEYRSLLEKQGMVFNQPDLAPFRQKLTSAGFYKEWREKMGSQAWGLLEKYSGPLA